MSHERSSASARFVAVFVSVVVISAAATIQGKLVMGKGRSKGASIKDIHTVGVVGVQ